MADPDHNKCGRKHDHAAQRDLDKGEILRLDSKTEHCRKSVPKCIHPITVSAD